VLCKHITNKEKNKRNKVEEEIHASTELGLFFKKLLDLKEYVKDQAESREDEILNEIYSRLNEIIKEKK